MKKIQRIIPVALLATICLSLAACDGISRLRSFFHPEESPQGFNDKEVAMRLRKEIYETGDSRDVNASIEKFLGRDFSIQAFLKRLGISTAN